MKWFGWKKRKADRDYMKSTEEQINGLVKYNQQLFYRIKELEQAEAPLTKRITELENLIRYTNKYDLVRKFHDAFEVEQANTPTMLAFTEDESELLDFYGNSFMDMSEELKRTAATQGGVQQRTAFILEELAEFMLARTLVDQIDALGDILFLSYGSYGIMGYQPDYTFRNIFFANMRKLGADGKPIKEDGKVKKPPGWYGPEADIERDVRLQTKYPGASPFSLEPGPSIIIED